MLSILVFWNNWSNRIVYCCFHRGKLILAGNSLQNGVHSVTVTQWLMLLQVERVVLRL